MKTEFWSFVQSAVARPALAIIQLLTSFAEVFDEWTAEQMEESKSSSKQEKE